MIVVGWAGRLLIKIWCLDFGHLVLCSRKGFDLGFPTYRWGDFHNLNHGTKDIGNFSA